MIVIMVVRLVKLVTRMLVEMVARLAVRMMVRVVVRLFVRLVFRMMERVVVRLLVGCRVAFMIEMKRHNFYLHIDNICGVCLVSRHKSGKCNSYFWHSHFLMI